MVKLEDIMSLTGFGFSSILIWLMLFLVIAPPFSYTHKQTSKEYEDSPSYQNALFIVDASVDELKDIQDRNVRIELTEQILKLLEKNKFDRCHQMLDSLFDSA